MNSRTPETHLGDGGLRRLIERIADPRGAVVVLLIVILIAIVVLNSSFAEPGALMRFIQRVSPVAIVAIGQYFVIVSGEFDLSMGAVVTAQVMTAGHLIGEDDSKTVPVLIIMLVIGVVVGIVNGLATTLLKVPSFIVTLGTMLVIHGAVMWWTGGAATGNPAESFRQLGRGGIEGIPVLGLLPYAVLILIAAIVFAVWISRRPFGRTVVAIGDNAQAVSFAGANVWRTKTLAFVLSSLAATVAGVLLAGYAGVHPSVGQGYEFTAITAVVLGGVVLGGGRGTVIGALIGAFTLESLFTLLNFTSVPATMRDAIQGAIIIAAVAYSGVVFAKKRKRPTTSAIDPTDPTGSTEPRDPSTTSAEASSPIQLTGGDDAARK
ncbi:ABC transporter permease [Brevibacterium aurantiacum]|uniref:Autoinducer 2 import system permease protein LsrD n=1 Tax=Brevibacterium aurantiacum TaxID=273384 RepID=A0A1D7VZ93_BREAU|nr:ABC transporter permease [Brevibacterium aurantiacum]AOP51788.1 Ribose ABC transport system, permease protein RbsC [Brevibacterium aurantiacum]RCS98161.1 ABC transporter permease [Brevibacterium aurantiacum]